MKLAIAIFSKSILLFETMRKFVQKSSPQSSPQANFTPLQTDDIKEDIIIKGAEKIRRLYQKADEGIIYVTQIIFPVAGDSHSSPEDLKMPRGMPGAGGAGGAAPGGSGSGPTIKKVD